MDDATLPLMASICSQLNLVTSSAATELMAMRQKIRCVWSQQFWDCVLFTYSGAALKLLTSSIPNIDGQHVQDIILIHHNITASGHTVPSHCGIEGSDLVVRRALSSSQIDSMFISRNEDGKLVNTMDNAEIIPMGNRSYHSAPFLKLLNLNIPDGLLCSV